MRHYLKKSRIKKKLTQQQMAEKLDISLSYYCQIESGERQKDLDLSIATKLAEIFNVTVEWIAEQEQRIKNPPMKT